MVAYIKLLPTPWRKMFFLQGVGTTTSRLPNYRQSKGWFTRYDFVACDKLTTGHDMTYDHLYVHNIFTIRQLHSREIFFMLSLTIKQNMYFLSSLQREINFCFFLRKSHLCFCRQWLARACCYNNFVHHFQARKFHIPPLLSGNLSQNMPISISFGL